MFLEMRLNVFLGDCSSGLKVSQNPTELGNPNGLEEEEQSSLVFLCPSTTKECLSFIIAAVSKFVKSFS